MHGLQLRSIVDGHQKEIAQRSMLGMIDVYNILPASIVEQCPCVKSFQSALQTLASKCASRGVDEWHHMYSSRFRMHVHPLVQMWSYDHSLSDH